MAVPVLTLSGRSFAFAVRLLLVVVSRLVLWLLSLNKAKLMEVAAASRSALRRAPRRVRMDGARRIRPVALSQAPKHRETGALRPPPPLPPPPLVAEVTPFA